MIIAAIALWMRPILEGHGMPILYPDPDQGNLRHSPYLTHLPEMALQGDCYAGHNSLLRTL